MKKIITITCLLFSALLILDSMNTLQAVFMFYLAGKIPGTQTYLSGGTMMELFALLIGFVLARLGNRSLLSLFNHLSVRSQNS